MKSRISFERAFYNREGGEVGGEEESKARGKQSIFLHSSLFFPQRFIDFRTQKNEKGGEVKPEHENHNRTQRAVGAQVELEVRDVIGKQR